MQKIAEESKTNHVALIAPEVAELFNLLITMGKYKKVLEIGTGIGYSTICFAHAVLPQNGQVVTIERMPQRVQRAREFFEQSGLTNITSYAGEAQDIFPYLEGNFDVIFMDAAMGQYNDFFEVLFPRLAPGGLLIADNVLFENLVERDKDDIPRRRRTMQQRLKDFLHLIKNHPQITTAVLPLGDGLALARRHEKDKETLE